LDEAGRRHVAFAFSVAMVYPPDSDNNKTSYVTRELLRRGARVTWVRLAGPRGKWAADGIDFVELSGNRKGFMGPWIRLGRFLSWCRKEKVDCVYGDDWLFLREHPMQRLVVQVGLRTLGIGFAYDQRDPYVDFQVATGALAKDSWTARQLTTISRLAARFTDLCIWPSQVYEKEMRARGLTAKHSIGVIRGVDGDAFNPDVDGRPLRQRLGLEGKFVVGWIGMMLPYRQIKETLIPLIEGAFTIMPDVHFIIGGQGEMEEAFRDLVQRKPELNLSLLGYVPYAELPGTIAACDVMLCPLNADHEFIRNSTPLKIIESLAMGRPVIATAVRAKDDDYSGLEGIIWTGSGHQDFARALALAIRDYGEIRARAEAQARRFSAYLVSTKISLIVDQVERSCFKH
jgi:glycosyltransferase involved in cell wall biosynthesis